MTTKETIETYFEALKVGDSWQEHLAEDMVFTTHTAPREQVTGRDAYLESTRGFFGIVDSVEVRELLIDGNRACALTSYGVKPPVGDPFICDVAEVFTVSDDRIDSFAIYFDSAPFPA